MKWTHQFQFAGYYMAKELGYYRQAGLAVDFLEADASINPIKRVLRGEAEFGVGTTDLIKKYVNGEPVVVLGVILQHSPIGLVTTRPDIKSVEDLRGKKIMIEENSAELFAFLEAKGLKESDYILHKHKLSLSDLISQKVDVSSIYKTTEIPALESKNIDYQAFYPISSGIDFYGDNLFTTQDMVENHLEVVEAFRQASFRGWQYAMTNKEETIRHILSTYVTDRTYEQLQFEANVMEELMQTDRIYPGNMTKYHWERIAKTYMSVGFIDSVPNLDNFIYQSETKVAEIYQKLIWAVVVISFTLLLLLALIYISRRFHKQKKQYQTLVQEAPISILIIDKTNHVQHWNRQAEKTFGWQANEVIGKNILDFLVGKNNREAIAQLFEEIRESGNRIQTINENTTKSGELINCNWTNSRYGEPLLGQMICMAIDVTEFLDEVDFEQVKKDAKTIEDKQKNTVQALDKQNINNKQEQDFDEKTRLAEIMNLSLIMWQTHTGKGRIKLAEKSQLWRVTIDGSTAKTRTLDKYLSRETIPNNPRWRKVIDTAIFVMGHAPDSEQKKHLNSLIETFTRFKSSS
ncbi:ABC transporter substrate-binding protein [Thiomicrorhabdus indica]|uniref:ABC transporter substrate-binding protein n=1 Tax=Thiomicrorhabdus indica TaxID=2267253 RepID=UPI0013EE45C4|nr:ABC transporter substrate-binding protein [Thiomicrorhabdus indica]